MTREEHIYQLKQYLKGHSICMCPSTSLYWKEHWEEVVKALEQEPMVEIDLYSVIKQKYIEREVLDKIRAEITSLSNANPSYWHSGDMVEREEVLDIIDKYKAE